MLVTNHEIITSFQRSIIRGLILFTENLEEIRKRVEIVELILNEYQAYFTKNQLAIVNLIYRDYKKYSEDGFYGFGISEVSEKLLFRLCNDDVINEYFEILSYSPLSEGNIYVYLKQLEKYFISNQLGVAI